MDPNQQTYGYASGVLDPRSGECQLNMKQIVEDNTENARRRTSNSADFDKAMNQVTIAGAQASQTLQQFALAGLIQAGQTGMTENQQSVTPVRQATGDAIVGGVGVSAEQVAANVADLATSLIPAMANGINQAWAQSYQLFTASLPTLVAAMGGASTPSQTQAKPTATTGS
jgi:hypothetical protein